MSNERCLEGRKSTASYRTGKLGWPLRRIKQATSVRRETARAYLKSGPHCRTTARFLGNAHSRRCSSFRSFEDPKNLLPLPRRKHAHQSSYTRKALPSPGPRRKLLTSYRTQSNPSRTSRCIPREHRASRLAKRALADRCQGRVPATELRVSSLVEVLR